MGRSPTPASDTLLPDGEGYIDYRTWTYNLGSSIEAAVSDSNDATWAYRDGGVFNDRQSFTLSAVTGTIPPQSLVTSVVITVKAVGIAGGGARDIRIYIGSDDSPFLSGVGEYTVGPSYPQTINHNVTNYPPLGGFPWTVDKLNRTAIVLESGAGTPPANPNGVYISQVQLDVTFDTAATQYSIVGAQNVGSRLLRSMRKMARMVKIDTPLLWPLDIELLDRFNLSTDAIDSPDGKGWGVKSWQRGLLALMAVEFNLQELKLSLEGYDLSDYITSLWATYATEIAPGYLHKGSAFLADYDKEGGNEPFNIVRATQAIIEHPVDTSRALFIPNATPKLNSKGLLCEQSAVGHIPYSEFGNGLTGWTSSGSGTVETSSNSNMSTYVTKTSLKLTAGSPLSSDLQVQSTASASIAANTKVRVTVDHQDQDATKKFYWALFRATGSQWWNDTTGAWSGSKVWNACTGTTGWARQESKQISIGASASTVTLYVGIPSTGGTAGQVNYCSQAEVITGSYVTSRIAVNASAYTRNADKVYYPNDATYGLLWPYDQQSGCLQVITLWDSSDLASGEKRVASYMYIDANNYAEISYDKDAGAWQFIMKRGGSTYTVSKTGAVTKGQRYTLAWRVTGVEGEQGLAPYTMSLWVDGEKAATDAVASGVLSGVGTWYIGCANTVNQLDGYISNLYTTEIVYSDERMVQLP